MTYLCNYISLSKVSEQTIFVYEKVFFFLRHYIHYDVIIAHVICMYIENLKIYLICAYKYICLEEQCRVLSLVLCIFSQ